MESQLMTMLYNNLMQKDISRICHQPEFKETEEEALFRLQLHRSLAAVLRLSALSAEKMYDSLVNDQDDDPEAGETGTPVKA